VASTYEKSVFINCPFDEAYKPIFNAIVFTVHRCGFILRCSKEFGESSTIRIQNIIGLIDESKYAIHDLSRVSTQDELPRFNMPLELGICIGALTFGSPRNKAKKYLITASEKYEYQKYISDLSGQDIQAHSDKFEDAIKVVRNWLSTLTSETVPSPSIIIDEYNRFISKLPEMCKIPEWVEAELTFHEYLSLVINWLSTE
jgi:hypothetical protein